MRTIAIRQATLADLHVLLHFQEGVRAAEMPYDPTIQDGPVQYYDIPALLASEQVLFVVAESDAGIAGCGFARIEAAKPYLRHALHAYLGLMYVDPAFRGQSVIATIIEALKHWSLVRGVCEFRLEVYAGNKSAIRAYEKAGFQTLIVEMRCGC